MVARLRETAELGCSCQGFPHTDVLPPPLRTLILDLCHLKQGMLGLQNESLVPHGRGEDGQYGRCFAVVIKC